MSNSANITPRKAESLPHKQQSPVTAINNTFNNIINKKTIIRADSLEDNSNNVFENIIMPQIKMTEKIELIEMNKPTAIEETLKTSKNNNDNNTVTSLIMPVKSSTDEEVATKVELGSIMIEDVNKVNKIFLF